jgi:acetyl esterase/lipase
MVTAWACGPGGFAEAEPAPAPVQGYVTRTGIPYRDDAGGDEAMRNACRLDVYHPETPGNHATVVWFHGGGLTGGAREIPAALKQQGIVVVAADYRLSPAVKAPVYIEDAAAAVAWVLAHIGDYGGSSNRVFVSGHSAGGYLALMVGLDRRYLAAHGAEADRLAGLAPLSAQAITHFTIRKERGIGERQPVVDELAPLFHVRADAPPVLLITGDREQEMLGRYEENAYLWRMLKVAGHRSVELRELPGFDHGGMVAPAMEPLLRFVRDTAPAR